MQRSWTASEMPVGRTENAVLDFLSDAPNEGVVGVSHRSFLEPATNFGELSDQLNSVRAYATSIARSTTADWRNQTCQRGPITGTSFAGHTSHLSDAG
jgi:hypothetical protein